MSIVDFSILFEINERLKRIEERLARIDDLEQERSMTAEEAARHILGDDASPDEVKRKAAALTKRAYRGRSLRAQRDGRAYLFKRKDVELMRRCGATKP